MWCLFCVDALMELYRKTMGDKVMLQCRNQALRSGTEEHPETEVKTPDVQEAVPYVQPEMKGEITISCLYAEEFLNTAAEQFMKLYPDVKVTVNSYKESASESA